MISSKAKHPNCMYMWMNWIVSPMANAEVAQFFEEAPAQSLACQPATLAAAAKAIGYTPDPHFCDESPRWAAVVLEPRVLLADPDVELR